MHDTEVFQFQPSARHQRVSSRFVVVALCLSLFASACGGNNQQTNDAQKGADTVSEAITDTDDTETDFAPTAPATRGTQGDAAISEEQMSEEMAEEEMADAEEIADEEMAQGARLEAAAESAPMAASEPMADSDSESTFASEQPAPAVRSPDDGDAEGLFSQPADEPTQRIEPERSRLEDNRFTNYGYRQFIESDDDPLSTFALDVDTGSWTVARRWLREGVLPPAESVRVEEFVNAFDYDYDVPRRGLEVSVDGGPSPFDNDNHLVRVGVQAEIVDDGDRPPVSLTFLVDTSGSMDRDDRLGLVKESLHTLVDGLDDDDTVSLVVYSDDSGVILEPTRVSQDRLIHSSIDSLRAGGSTNLESGLREGYQLAADSFRSNGVNRVIIASDGVANAGITDQRVLSDYIRNFADEGIQLVTVGYGMGNFNDTMMEQLADNGDGFYAYVDTIDEAERLFDEELTSTLVTAAIDAKIQVEFDADIVDEYRLIGFENRGVRDNDFRNDSVDAGELGAGHQVTAMYEIRLRRGVTLSDRGDIGEVYLRWQDPTTGDVMEIDEDIDLGDVAETFQDTEPDFQVATVVTAFAEVLRDNPYADDVDLRNVMNESFELSGDIDNADRAELQDMLLIATELTR